MAPPEIEIILVEDNPRDAELTIHALEKRNLANRIIWLKDGAEALDYFFGADQAKPLLQCDPRVILLDLKLPKVDGMEVLRRLKSDAGTCAIPVVALTASKEGQDIARCYALGANSYIVKPVSFDNFSDAVATLGMYWLLLNQPPGNISPGNSGRSHG
jgi:two-component system, response regulator